MFIKGIKYFSALTIFILGCIGIIYNKEKNTKVMDFAYKQNRYSELSIEYIATLHIPKISLTKVLYSIDDKRNSLDKNIIFVNDSSMPDEEKGNVIIAGHNGNSEISFFRELHKLDINDIFVITYKNINYNYKIVKKYLVEKDGKVEIIKDTRYSTATLITCFGNDKQLVFIANLITKK